MLSKMLALNRRSISIRTSDPNFPGSSPMSGLIFGKTLFLSPSYLKDDVLLGWLLLHSIHSPQVTPSTSLSLLTIFPWGFPWNTLRSIAHLCSDAPDISNDSSRSAASPSKRSEHLRNGANQKLGVILNLALPPHMLPGTVHIPHSISDFCGSFFLNLSITYLHALSQFRPPSHLGYFNGISNWPCLLAASHAPVKASQAPTLCSCTHELLFFTFPLANS